ncbi:hypothetical protein J9E33_002405 [Salmonella enterica]|uniref:hypothetical protein n=1 Tax=Salmonella enterica TaxID=28901 RepID=UPI0009B070C9|nr:hypothetical protein [Salmonella enterica]EBW2268528.1 hypothetical protein [Salmonella enterica subsp. enterica serovar Hillingdon]ECB6312621.1 hypothetical protein [Salmonella enterica subsp. enterica serovar Chailey]EDR3562116.1 hypothetical protein [Salmonella enterica subsp. enterica serovar Benue]MIW33699.1 hypothetical protein [Salmonella enterica subsp. enterica serovar Derby]EDR0865650.1 hypothetical protein [Salmonella enterica subsp. enterica serovar Hillingdon]
MTGYELRLWRKGFRWDQERAAEELGVSIRTYKSYEKKVGDVSKMVELATYALSLRSLYPELAAPGLSPESILQRLKIVVPNLS